MSRLVVLTDEEIRSLLDWPASRPEWDTRELAKSKLSAALEQPEGISEAMVERAAEWLDQFVTEIEATGHQLDGRDTLVDAESFLRAALHREDGEG